MAMQDHLRKFSSSLLHLEENNRNDMHDIGNSRNGNPPYSSALAIGFRASD
jgi:hypothetical protein